LTKAHTTADIIVVGAGPLGMMAALILAKSVGKITLIGPEAPKDGRTTAIMNDGLAFLDEIGIWSELSSMTAPLSVMRLVDGTSRLISRTRFGCLWLQHEEQRSIKCLTRNAQ